MKSTLFVSVIVVVQVFCAFFFVGEILVTLFGLSSQPMRWETRELIEIGAAIGLVLGVGLGTALLVRTARHSRHVEDKLRGLSTAFRDLMEERFADWGLTPAERDVALFAIKGLSTAEIATLRATSEGTVKAQTNAIYRKAGVNGRSQLLSLFIEDLMDGAILPEEEARLVPVAALPVSRGRRA